MAKKERSDVSRSEDQELDHMRHSCSHILAQAVLDMFPDAQLGIGPTTDTGFYYDFDLPRTLIPEDLDILQKKMEQISKEKQVFKRVAASAKKATEFYTKAGQKYKVELIKDLEAAGEKEITFYENVDADGKVRFSDLCRGGHSEHTGKVGAFKLTHIAGAYWRGDEKRPMLQRIYGVCFKDGKELRRHLEMMEEAKKRDHRKLGKELDLYTYDENVGPGLPLWLPKGAVIVEELETLAKEEEFKDGYVRVRTPHLTKGKLYEMSGHLSHYKASMYPAMKVDNEEYYVKPMNCPHHHMCFKASPKSYRNLPLRYAEYGTCYRYEDSGALFGLMRVRSLQMNDAHIYCTGEQFESEFNRVTQMYLRYFKLFGIDKYVMRLSLHSKEGLGEKYVDDEKMWLKTEEMVRKALINAKVPYVEAEDEAAFYGPKVDIEVWSAIGREFTLATNQVDFAVPRRMGLSYTDESGKENIPLCIHRAPLSTHERFIGFLIEHFAGAFPTWLAPVQVKVLPISDKFLDYANEVAAGLRSKFVRAEVDSATESLGKKIRNAEMMKVPYMLVVGEKEVADGTVALRSHKSKVQKVMNVADFEAGVLEEIKERRLEKKVAE